VKGRVIDDSTEFLVPGSQEKLISLKKQSSGSIRSKS
jgi:hypothetical protein